MQAMIITGQRHEREDGRECFCGCHWTDGRTGSIVQDNDTPKLATLGMLIVDFPACEHRGVPWNAVQVAYSYAELGLSAPAVEPESHEAMRLFAPAPNQMPGQMTL